jgi:hypothetical protein
MILAALLLSTLAQAEQPPDPLTFDLRCMIVAASLRESQDANTRAAASGASLFFFGRVDSRLTEAELERRLTEESAAVLAGNRAEIMRACGAFMQVRGQAMIAIGQRMMARGRSQATQ